MSERPAHNYFLTNDARQRINRFLGPVAFSVAAVLNPFAAIAAAVGLVSYEWWRMARLEDESAKRLLNATEAELCQMISKPVGKLNLSDFDRFAKAGPGSPDEVTAFRRFRENGAIGLYYNLFATAIAVGATALFAASGGLAAVVGLMATAGFAGGFFTAGILSSSIVGGVYLLTKSLSESYLNDEFMNSLKPNIANQYLMISQQIQEKSLEPDKVFGLFVKARPQLDSVIRQKHGREFFNLPVELRHKVIQEFEPSIKAIALTEAVNKGDISKGMLLLIPYENGRQTSGYNSYLALRPKTNDAVNQASPEPTLPENQRSTNHAAELENKRQELLQATAEPTRH